MIANGTYYISFSESPKIDIKIVLKREDKLDVLIYVEDNFDYPAVSHFLDFKVIGIKVVDICGNGPNSVFHHKGLGTLAVNAAIQILKAIYPPETKIFGHVFDSKDFDLPKADQPKRQTERKVFWQKFGFAISLPDSRGDEHLCGSIGELTMQTKGKVLDVHPRHFDISELKQIPEGVKLRDWLDQKPH